MKKVLLAAIAAMVMTIGASAEANTSTSASIWEKTKSWTTETVQRAKDVNLTAVKDNAVKKTSAAVAATKVFAEKTVNVTKEVTDKAVQASKKAVQKATVYIKNKTEKVVVASEKAAKLTGVVLSQSYKEAKAAAYEFKYRDKLNKIWDSLKNPVVSLSHDMLVNIKVQYELLYSEIVDDGFKKAIEHRMQKISPELYTQEEVDERKEELKKQK